MRHRKLSRKMGGDSAYRRSLLKNMTISLLEHKVIKVTLPRAKELRIFVEPLITLAKKDDLIRRRRAFALLGNKTAVTQLFTEAAPRSMQRPGGYTRIMKSGYRKGDNAALAYIELVDKDVELTVKEEKTTTSVRGTATKDTKNKGVKE